MKAHSTSDAARFAAVFTGLLLLASVPVALAADAPGVRSQAAGLNASSGSLDSRTAAATLELYALESQLARARSELAGIESQRAALAGKQASTRSQLAVAKHAVVASQTQLARLIRALYQQSSADPLAIVLGASSLEEALAGLDGISRAAGQNNRIVAQARSARTRLASLGERLAERQVELDRLAEAARARASTLAAAAADRRRLIGDLRKQKDVNAARIAAIEAQAHEAGVRTTAIAASRARAADAAPVEAALAPVEQAAASRPSSGPGTLTVTVTGYSLRGSTATGIQTAPGVVAVDPSVIPLGSRLTIPGYGVGIAADTGGAVRGNTIDVWFPTTAEALRWGRRTVTITIH